MEETRGDFIDNAWIRPTGPEVIRSLNPATDGEIVAEGRVDAAHAAVAVEAARRAWPAWAGLTVDERLAALRRFARELSPRTEPLAKAITREIGKPLRESRAEAQSLIERIELVADHQLPLVRPWAPTGVEGECRYHPLGVIAVLGPFSAPLQLLHAHVVPALLTGNTVVIKPSERAPLAAQLYVEALAAANLPPVVQLLQGGPDVGRALVATPGLGGVAFTGSWRAGHAIERALVDRPEVLAALEMGGQNVAIVLADADLDQALEGVLLGAFLSTGQRCTRTSRVLVERRIAPIFLARLAAGARELTVGDPFGDAFMGPLASMADRLRVDALCEAGVRAGAEPLLAGLRRAGGAWRTPSLHRVAADHDSEYTREEVFGPDLAVTEVDGLDDAIELVNRSPYGLSVSVFTARRAALEKVYLHTRVGCVSWNRSTHRSSPAMPQGGVGRSGNYRPSGSDAVRSATYPVQVLWAEAGSLEGDGHVRAAVHRSDPVSALDALHRLEEACEPYGLEPTVDPDGAVRLPLSRLEPTQDLARPLLEALRERRVDADLGERDLRLKVPPGATGARRLAAALTEALHSLRAAHPARFLGRTAAVGAEDASSPPPSPRSDALLRRAGLSSEGRAGVIDLRRSADAWLATVDDPPRLAPAAPLGALHDPAVQSGLWDGRFGASLLDDAPAQPSTSPEARRLAALFRAASPHHPWVAFAATRGLALELAVGACATRHPSRRALVTFAGAELGPTLLGRRVAAFEVSAPTAPPDDVRVVPRPPSASGPAPEPSDWLDSWSSVAATPRPAPNAADADLAAEIAALDAVASAVADDRAAAVLFALDSAPPTARFARALRAVTATAGVPLILDATALPSRGPADLDALSALTASWPSPPDLVVGAPPWSLAFVLSGSPLPEGDPVATTAVTRDLLRAEAGAPCAPRPAAPPAAPAVLPSGYRVIRLTDATWATLRAPWDALRRTVHGAPRPELRHLDPFVADPDALAFAVVQGSELPPRGKLVGAILAVPLELLSPWPDAARDRAAGAGDTLYALDLTVAPDHREAAVDRALEHALLAAAMTATRPDGSPRYAYLATLEAAASASAPALRAERYGAASRRVFDASGAPATVSRVALSAPQLPEAAALPTRTPGRPYLLAPGLERRLGDVRDRGEGADELVAAAHAGRLSDAVIHALSPDRALTPAAVRAMELLRALAPKGLGRLRLAPSRSALADTALAAFGRDPLAPVLALGPVDAGPATAAARAISLPAGAPDSPWRWPTLPDPTLDPERTLGELRRELTQRGAARVQAVAVEAVYARTGRAVPEALWRPLRALCDEHAVPLLLWETATGGFRSGRGMWRADTLPVPPDAVLWPAGPQLGLVFLRDGAGPDTAPLGEADTLALVRLAWEIRLIRNLPIAHRAQALARALAPLGAVHGEGLYRTVTTAHAPLLARRLAERGLVVEREGEDLLRFAPPLNVPTDVIERLAAALREIAP